MKRPKPNRPQPTATPETPPVPMATLTAADRERAAQGRFEAFVKQLQADLGVTLQIRPVVVFQSAATTSAPDQNAPAAPSQTG